MRKLLKTVRLILKKGRAHREYIIMMRRKSKDKFELVTFWGRVGFPHGQNQKKYEGFSKYDCKEQMNRLIMKMKTEGYRRVSAKRAKSFQSINVKKKAKYALSYAQLRKKHPRLKEAINALKEKNRKLIERLKKYKLKHR
jgi:hypothetical protein